VQRCLPRTPTGAGRAPGLAAAVALYAVLGTGLGALWAGGLVFAAYGLALAVLGGRLVVRRDLT